MSSGLKMIMGGLKKKLWILPFCTLWGASPAPDTGVLVLAHGGNPEWNRIVEECVKDAHLTDPYQIVFGMGDSNSEVYQAAVDALRSRGARRIVSIPLLISSHSEVYRQYEFLLHLRPSPAFPHPIPMDSMVMPPGHLMTSAKPLHLDAPVVLTQALDSSPWMADSLLERATEISRAPSRETVILVAHGPNGDKDNVLWERSLGSWTQALRRKNKFKNVVSLTLRDDAPEIIRSQATERLRLLVAESSKEGDALIVPVLLAPGGIEEGILKRLEGLSYRMSRPLLPDPRISRWIHDQVEETFSHGS